MKNHLAGLAACFLALGACQDESDPQDAPEECETRDFTEECAKSEDCGPGRVCVDSGRRVPSRSIVCTSGGSSGTADLRIVHECRAATDCTTPNPGATQCNADEQCPSGQTCNDYGQEGCVPMGCLCDQTVGTWVCGDACSPLHCGPARDAGADASPPDASLPDAG